MPQGAGSQNRRRADCAPLPLTAVAFGHPGSALTQASPSGKLLLTRSLRSAAQTRVI